MDYELSITNNAEMDTSLSMVHYVNVKIPEELREKFEELEEKYRLGYASFAEIIKEALRRRFEEIEATYGKE